MNSIVQEPNSSVWKLESSVREPHYLWQCHTNAIHLGKRSAYIATQKPPFRLIDFYSSFRGSVSFCANSFAPRCKRCLNWGECLWFFIAASSSLFRYIYKHPLRFRKESSHLICRSPNRYFRVKFRIELNLNFGPWSDEAHRVALLAVVTFGSLLKISKFTRRKV